MSTLTETLARLSAIDTCALSDALDKLGLSGQVTGLRRESGEGRVAGVAVTVKLGTGDPPPGPPSHLGTKAIEASDEHSIIVVEQRSGVEAGCWGGLLTRGARLAGVRAVVADGPVQFGELCLRIHHHGAELQAREVIAVTAGALLAEEDRASVVQLDLNCGEKKQGSERQYEHAGADQVEGPLT